MNNLSAILVLLLPALSGCVHTTVASVSQNSEHPEISIVRKTTGYEPGICGVVKNGCYPVAWIDLSGKKDRYFDQDFTVRFPSDRYLDASHKRKVSGSVSVNWESKKMRIDFMEEGRKSNLNGTYNLKE